MRAIEKRLRTSCPDGNSGKTADSHSECWDRPRRQSLYEDEYQIAGKLFGGEP